MKRRKNPKESAQSSEAELLEQLRAPLEGDRIRAVLNPQTPSAAVRRLAKRSGHGPELMAAIAFSPHLTVKERRTLMHAGFPPLTRRSQAFREERFYAALYYLYQARLGLSTLSEDESKAVAVTGTILRRNNFYRRETRPRFADDLVPPTRQPRPASAGEGTFRSRLKDAWKAQGHNLEGLAVGVGLGVIAVNITVHLAAVPGRDGFEILSVAAAVGVSVASILRVAAHFGSGKLSKSTDMAGKSLTMVIALMVVVLGIAKLFES